MNEESKKVLHELIKKTHQKIIMQSYNTYNYVFNWSKIKVKKILVILEQSILNL
jgi:adenine-specific DNA methylase